MRKVGAGAEGPAAGEGRSGAAGLAAPAALTTVGRNNDRDTAARAAGPTGRSRSRVKVFWSPSGGAGPWSRSRDRTSTAIPGRRTSLAQGSGSFVLEKRASTAGPDQLLDRVARALRDRGQHASRGSGPALAEGDFQRSDLLLARGQDGQHRSQLLVAGRKHRLDVVQLLVAGGEDGLDGRQLHVARLEHGEDLGQLLLVAARPGLLPRRGKGRGR